MHFADQFRYNNQNYLPMINEKKLTDDCFSTLGTEQYEQRKQIQTDLIQDQIRIEDLNKQSQVIELCPIESLSQYQIELSIQSFLKSSEELGREESVEIEREESVEEEREESVEIEREESVEIEMNEFMEIGREEPRISIRIFKMISRFRRIQDIKNIEKITFNLIRLRNIKRGPGRPRKPPKQKPKDPYKNNYRDIRRKILKYLSKVKKIKQLKISERRLINYLRTNKDVTTSKWIIILGISSLKQRLIDYLKSDEFSDWILHTLKSSIQIRKAYIRNIPAIIEQINSITWNSPFEVTATFDPNNRTLES